MILLDLCSFGKGQKVQKNTGKVIEIRMPDADA